MHIFILIFDKIPLLPYHKIKFSLSILGDLSDDCADRIESLIQNLANGGLNSDLGVDFLFKVALPVARIWFVQSVCDFEHDEALFYLNHCDEYR